MNKAKELLNELQNLDMDIQSRIDEINELEAGLLSSPKWTADKVKGGQAKKVGGPIPEFLKGLGE